MKIRAVVCALALGLLTVGSASAQQLETGKWTGKVIVPVEGAPQMDLTFDVKNEEGKTSVTMNFLQAPMPFTLNEIKLADKKLTFSFAPGNDVVRCELTLQEDKSYAGDCVEDGDPMKVRMTMTPPKKDGGN